MLQKKQLRSKIGIHFREKYRLFHGLIFCIVCAGGAIVPSCLWAEEKPAPKEGEEASGFIKKDEYLELKSAVEQLNAKVRQKKEELKKLLVEKDQIKNPLALKEIGKRIEKEYREINEMLENVDKKQVMLRYRFPERTFERSSNTEKFQKIEDIGAEATVEKQVDDLLGVVETQYKRPIRSEAVRRKSLREPAGDESMGGASSEHQNPEDFTKTLILRK